MLFNCLGCGISVSSKKAHCPYCKINNAECIEMLAGPMRRKPEKLDIAWKERLKGTILSYVHR